MKTLDWAETFGNFVTMDICPSIYLASVGSQSPIMSTPSHTEIFKKKLASGLKGTPITNAIYLNNYTL